MKKSISTMVVLCVCLLGCNSAQTQKSSVNQADQLNGSWQLNYISGPRIAFEGLYPNKKPSITFDLKENRVSGNNSCNSYTGKLMIDGNKISFKEPMAVTKMMCMDSQGETVYMKMLQQIDSYSISEDGKTLNFLMGDIAMMRFEKK